MPMNKFRRLTDAPVLPAWLEFFAALATWNHGQYHQLTLHCCPETGEITVRLEGLYEPAVRVAVDYRQPIEVAMTAILDAGDRLCRRDLRTYADREGEEIALMEAAQDFERAVETRVTGGVTNG